MPTETKQKQKFCRDCGRKTLHVATIQTQEIGCAFFAGHLFLSVLTLGLWIPLAVFLFGMGTFANALAPLGAKYHCQKCGRRN